MAKAVQAKTSAEEAYRDSMDAASEFGYEMGMMFEKARIEEEINAILLSLTDEEEDARLTLEIVKQIVARTDVANNE
jgi:phosphopantetheine adenylyltransferase